MHAARFVGALTLTRRCKVDGSREGGVLASLSVNNIGDAGAQALAAALPSCAALKTLK